MGFLVAGSCSAVPVEHCIASHTLPIVSTFALLRTYPSVHAAANRGSWGLSAHRCSATRACAPRRRRQGSMQASTAANNSDTRAQLRRRRVRLRQHDRPLDGAWRLGMATVVTRHPPISFAPSSVPFLFPWPHRTAGISAAELTARPPGLFRAKSALSFHRPTPRVQHKAALVGSWRAFSGRDAR